MKTTYLKITTAFLILCTLFQACKRDEPVLEVDQEEFDRIEVLFTPSGADLSPVKIVFNRFGVPEKTEYTLSKDTEYHMQITLFHEDENLNEEIIEEGDEHQFFFFAPADALLDLQYLDENIGLEGILHFGAEAEPFTLKVLLRHGLDKESEFASRWNHPLYVQAGGVDDLLIQIPLVLK